MEIKNSFDVPLPPAQAWAVLLDIPRIVPCMPGAELTGVVDADTYAGKVSVRLGPVALAFAGQVKFESVDRENHRARAKAQGRDTKGRGGANATVDFHLEPIPTGSKVLVRTDLNLSGAVAQYGRASGVIQEVASHLIGQFATCLKQQLEAAQVKAVQAAAHAPRSPAFSDMSAQPADVPPPPPVLLAPAGAKPISGVSLMLKVLWSSIRRLFGGR